jgi:phage tail-like protein
MVTNKPTEIQTLDHRPPVTRHSNQNRYLQFLPGIYSEDDFTSRFLSIFESVSRPIENTIDSISSYFDPSVASEEFLQWVSKWLNITLINSMPVERKRSIMSRAGDLFETRGTRIGLTKLLEVYTGLDVEIEENFGPFKLSPQSSLGNNTILGEGTPFTFTIFIHISDTEIPNLDQLRNIIDLEKPIHTNYSIELV